MNHARYLAVLLTVLTKYAELTGLESPKTDQKVVSDLLTDLHHWCDHCDWDFDSLNVIAHDHYLEEIKELNTTSS